MPEQNCRTYAARTLVEAGKLKANRTGKTSNYATVFGILRRDRLFRKSGQGTRGRFRGFEAVDRGIAVYQPDRSGAGERFGRPRCRMCNGGE